MALYSLLRRASSSVLPVAIRAVGSRKSFHVVRSIRGGEIARRNFVSSARPFSSAKLPADGNLVSVIESEIECGEEIEGRNSVDEIPDGFPFEIQDNPGERSIILTRKLGGETIEIIADIPNIETEGDDVIVDDDGHDVAQENTPVGSSIPLVVSISKSNGVKLEFGITAYSDEFTIDSLSIKKPDISEITLAYEGPEFHDLDENFQKAFQRYLEVRGIDKKTTSFLVDYMVDKEGKEYINWLKNLKSFVEN